MAPTINVYLVFLIASIKTCEFISLILFQTIFEDPFISKIFNWFSDPESVLKSKLTIWKYHITAFNFRTCVHTHYVLLYCILIFLHLWYSLNNKNESHFYSTNYSLYTKPHAKNIIKHLSIFSWDIVIKFSTVSAYFCYFTKLSWKIIERGMDLNCNNHWWLFRIFCQHFCNNLF